MRAWLDGRGGGKWRGRQKPRSMTADERAKLEKGKRSCARKGGAVDVRVKKKNGGASKLESQGSLGLKRGKHRKEREKTKKKKKKKYQPGGT